MGGFVGASIVSCTFPSTGTYLVTASVVARSGLTTSTAVPIAVSERPVIVVPPPPPPPAPAPKTLSLSITCTANVGGSTPCNAAGRMSDGEVVTSQLRNVHWDLGNGDTTVTPYPTINYTYKQPGTYLIIAEALVDGIRGSGSLLLDVK